MKKFSINLLKVTLLLILGLCVFSVGNEVRAVEYAATDIVLDKFNSDCGKYYEPGKATQANVTLKNVDHSSITGFQIYSCSCGCQDPDKFDDYKPHDYKKVKNEKIDSNNYKTKDGTFTLMNKNSKIYFKVGNANEFTHYRIVFDVTVYYNPVKKTKKHQGVTTSYTHYSEKEALENIDIYCVSKYATSIGGTKTDQEENDIEIKATKIEITNMPSRKTYKPGEKIDLTGLTAQITYSDNSTKIISYADDQVSVRWSAEPANAPKTEGSTRIKISATIGQAIKDQEELGITVAKKSNKDENPIVAVDKNGTTIAVDQYLKYTDITNEDGWNLRKAVNGGVKGVIEEGAILQVTELGSNNRYVKVKVLEGKLAEQEGWINITTNGAKNFEILASYTPAEGEGSGTPAEDEESDTPAIGEGTENDTPATGNLDLSGIVGAAGGIMELLLPMITSILSRLWEFLETAVLPNLEPAMDTGMQFITTVIGGLIK